MDAYSQYAVAAARQAVEHAGLDVGAEAEDIGAVVASGGGGLRTFEDQQRALLERGSGSRGSHLVMADSGERIHPDLPEDWKILPENKELRNEIIEIWMNEEGEFETRAVPVRPIPEREYWFETMWADYRSGKIYGEEKQ